MPLLPLLDGPDARRVAKQRLMTLISEQARGVSNALPADAVAAHLGWPPSCGHMVERLAREIMFDGPDIFGVLLGSCDDGMFLVVTDHDRSVAHRTASKRAHEYARIAQRLRPPDAGGRRERSRRT